MPASLAGGGDSLTLCYARVMDRTALAITLLIAFIAGLLVILRLYFAGQMDFWFD